MGKKILKWFNYILLLLCIVMLVVCALADAGLVNLWPTPASYFAFTMCGLSSVIGIYRERKENGKDKK